MCEKWWKKSPPVFDTSYSIMHCYVKSFIFFRFFTSFFLHINKIHSYHIWFFIFTFYWPVSLFHWASRLWEVSYNRLLSWWGVIKLRELLCGRTIKLLRLLWRGTIELLRLLYRRTVELLRLLCRRTVELLRGVAVRLLRRTEELRRGTVLSGHPAIWPRGGGGGGAPGAAPAVPVIALGPVVTRCEQGLGQKHRHVGSAGSHPRELAGSSQESWHWCRLMEIKLRDNHNRNDLYPRESSRKLNEKHGIPASNIHCKVEVYLPI